MPSGRLPNAPEWRGAGAVALLLGAGAVGLRAFAGLWSAPSPHLPVKPFLAAFAVLEAVSAVLLLVALKHALRAPRRKDGPVPKPLPGDRRTRLLLTLMALVIAGLPVVLLAVAAVLHSGHGERPVTVPPTHPSMPVLPAVPGQHHGSSGPGGWTPGLVAFGAVILLLVLAALVAGRRRPAGPAPAVAAPEPDRFDAAAAAAGRALLSVDDPRAAVVACYTAMEDVLAKAGAGPRGSDTPSEVLARASGAGLAGLGAAERLTGLFYEARYSVHPVTEEHRARALAALDELRTGDRS
ncbi:DUF4129 domain-containing protein [Actinomadura violacea]|uniref:DUF4129 domain-containing protein n=1 Tax=Actinomadura violacea TaxID=2819934 RepID=A0ABS3RQT2_9ACTN|nr:DUF4129 domain-containing protein [Actinomadura violacea]MBO2458663.1 DUF4129 domain-containing protein [Actinomadura violacea]